VSASCGPCDAFGMARTSFEGLLCWLDGSEAGALDHAMLEEQLDTRGRDLLRQLLQGHLDLRAFREERIVGVADADGVCHGAVEPSHVRPLSTIFGPVSVTRLAYRHRGHANLYPQDGHLNLPEERHSYGLRRLAAIESARGSFEEARAAIGRTSGIVVGKRQVEQLAARCAVDFDDFYAARRAPAAQAGDVVVLSCDGKGVVMRPESLRPQTAAAAARSENQLKTRLSKGEKANRKRMAEVGAVYSLAPVVRTPEQVMTRSAEKGDDAKAPKAANKWVTASVVDDAKEVIADVFAEASRRDPDNACDWVALVDGNRHQIDRIEAEAKARGIKVPIVIDLVHVLEYLWKAAWSFHAEGDPAAEEWVHEKALEVLRGKATIVAAAIRRKATALRLDVTARKNADTCADYLLSKAPYLDYPSALSNGWPVATGVIEGACRHLVKDRMDVTGARWSAQGAEAILKLRAVRSNGDFDDYWRYHLDRQHQRVHRSRYAGQALPAAA